jgi:hypothetical protein
MRKIFEGGLWAEILGFAVIAIILYITGFLTFLFAVPLQMLMIKRGYRAYLMSSFAVLVAVIISALVNTRLMENEELKQMLIFIELLFPVMLMAGIFAMNLESPYHLRKLYLLLGVTGAVGLVSIPIIYWLLQSEVFMTAMRDQVEYILSALYGSPEAAETGMNGGMLGRIFNPEAMMETLKEVVLRNYLFSFFLLLTLNWRVGYGLGLRSRGERAAGLKNFFLPDKMVWILLLAWAGILGDIFFGVGPLGYFVWNVGLIFLFLYGLQGMGIVQHVLSRGDMTRGLQLFIIVMIIVVLFIPFLNILLIIGIPIFGISEIWIKYRQPKRS